MYGAGVMSTCNLGENASAVVEGSRVAQAIVEGASCIKRASGSSERWRLGLCALVLSSVAFAIMPVSSFGQNLIINGGFTINGGDGHVALDSAPPWLSTGGNPYGYLICTTLNCGGLFSISPYNGVAYAAITLASGGGMSQTVTLAKSGNYQFSFDYATGPYLITPPPLEPVGITASVGGQTVFNKANLTAPTWTQFSTTVSLMAGANTVTFIGTPPLNNLADGFIDDVSLTCLNCPLSLGGGLPTNQTNVGNAINNFINGGGTLPTNFQNLFNYSPPQLQAALTQLDGEAATDAEKGAFALMNQFLGLMLDPFVTGVLARVAVPSPLRRSKRRASRPTSRSPMHRCLRRRRLCSLNAGPRGVLPSAPAARPTVMRRLAPTMSLRATTALPLVWIITSRRTRCTALRWPEPAPIGA